LKYPGKHQKYVDFHTYQQFVSFYKDDLINRSINFEMDSTIQIEPHQQYIYNVHAKKKEEPQIVNESIEEKTKPEESLEEPQISAVQESSEAELSSNSKESFIASSKLNKEKTNWMKVLLKGV
jgi:hypothetical protein